VQALAQSQAKAKSLNQENPAESGAGA